MHNTVNISWLEKCTADQVWAKPPSPPIQTVREEEGTIQCTCDVEGITLHNHMPVIKGGYTYPTKWEGYNEMTLEASTNLSKAKQMLDDYSE